MTLQLATPAGDGQVNGRPDGATHLVMFWPPSWDTLLEGLFKRFTGSGEWVIYTVEEFRAGDYCQGDRWRIGARPDVSQKVLTGWASSELGQTVTLTGAGETEYGPAYWIAPEVSR
jgi:hypothetical protein